MTPHHVLAIQVVQHCAEQLGTGLVVWFTGAVVQLPAQLVSDKWEKPISTICSTGAKTELCYLDHAANVNSFGADQTNLYAGVMHNFFSSCFVLCEMSLCGFQASRTPTWLPEKVTLHHFTHAAQLLTHKLQVRNALDELCE